MARGFFSRMADLWRGIWGSKLERAETANTGAVYHSAITRLQNKQTQLKEAVGRLIYLRNRVDSQLQRKSSDLSIVAEALRDSTAGNDDTRSLSLVRKRRVLGEEVERLHNEHQRLQAQADTAKQGLTKVAQSIGKLKQEKSEMLARKVHAEARLEVAHAMRESNVDLGQTFSALENVRESIERLEQAADLDGEMGTGDETELSLGQLRKLAQEREDREELERLKQRNKLASRRIVDAENALVNIRAPLEAI